MIKCIISPICRCEDFFWSDTANSLLYSRKHFYFHKKLITLQIAKTLIFHLWKHRLHPPYKRKSLIKGGIYA